MSEKLLSIRQHLREIYAIAQTMPEAAIEELDAALATVVLIAHTLERTSKIVRGVAALVKGVKK